MICVQTTLGIEQPCGTKIHCIIRWSLAVLMLSIGSFHFKAESRFLRSYECTDPQSSSGKVQWQPSSIGPWLVFVANQVFHFELVLFDFYSSWVCWDWCLSLIDQSQEIVAWCYQGLSETCLWWWLLMRRFSFECFYAWECLIASSPIRFLLCRMDGHLD